VGRWADVWGEKAGRELGGLLEKDTIVVCTAHNKLRAINLAKTHDPTEYYKSIKSTKSTNVHNVHRPIFPIL
jgi:hypothetical protein